MKIKSISIEGFRGISKTFNVDFKNGSNFTSCVVYGKNGTGKSSIVDAWEWLRHEKIGHLARENAGHEIYPHKKHATTKVILNLSDNGEDLETEISLFENKRIISNGDLLNKIKETLKYPCHIRYSDLQDFVHKTKKQKYEYLMKFLGYDKLLKIQEEFSTYYNQLNKKTEELNKSINQNRKEIIDLLEIKEYDEDEILKKINTFVKEHLGEISCIEKLPDCLNRIKKIINDDPNKKKIIELEDIKKNFNDLSTFEKVVSSASSFNKIHEELSEGGNNLALNLLKIYSPAVSYLDDSQTNICPVCDKQFEGDLKIFLEDKQSKLVEIKSKKEELDKIKSQLELDFSRVKNIVSQILKLKINEDEKFYTNFMNKKNDCDKLKSIIDSLNLEEVRNIENLDEMSVLFSCSDLINLLDSELVEVKGRVKGNLIDVSNKLHTLIQRNNALTLKEKELEKKQNAKEKFDQIYKKYNDWIRKKITDTFNEVSENVCSYFNILEGQASSHLKKPEIKLLEKDRAIELDIGFHDETISPAFKILSESQVNSFGISIFLACLRYFNQEFKFMILDDIINSLDGHKKRKMIELLRDEFYDFQILLLTHEILWYEQIVNEFKVWNKNKIIGWDIQNGPKLINGRTSLGEVNRCLDEDNSYLAGAIFGRYLEYRLQNLNQKFQSNIKYKIDNEYTLSELYDSLLSRVKDKLKDSDMHNALKNFDSLFRNFSAHYKNDNGNLTCEDINDSLNKWEDIEKLIKCKNCNRDVSYNGSYFICQCGTLKLEKKK